MSLSLQAREEALPHPDALRLLPPEGMVKPQEQVDSEGSLGSWREEPGAHWAPCARWECAEPLGWQDAHALGVWTWTGGRTGFLDRRAWL